MYKKIIKGKKAVFFDLDGTIIKDSPSYATQAVQKILDDVVKASYINAEDYDFVGVPIEYRWEVILKVNNLKDEKSVKELSDLTYQEILKMMGDPENDPVTEGFWDFIYEVKEEKGLKTALTTNSPKAVAMQILEKIGADKAFDYMIFGDEVKRTKPNPEMYKKALKALKIKPKEAVAFEDSVAGAQAATSAKIDVVVIWNGVLSKLDYPESVLEFFPDFTDLSGKLDEDYFEYMARRSEETKKDRLKDLKTLEN
jgi:HAD superfamily hydrolase (TIGR01509 family)